MDFQKKINRGKFKLGLFSRMLLALFLLLVTSLSILSISLLNGAEKQFNEFRLQHVYSAAKTLADASLDALVTEDYELLERFVNSSLPVHAGAYVHFTRPNGIILSSTDSDLLAKKILLPKTEHNELTHISSYKGRPTIEVIIKAFVGNTHLANAHLAIYTDEGGFNYLKDANGIIITLIILFIVISLGTYLIVKKIRVPILHLINIVEKTSFDKPIQLPKTIYYRTDEVGVLARAFNDVFSRLTAANKEIAIAHDAEVRASNVKSEFLQTMSHELRTPLHAITAYENLLSLTELNEKQAKFCGNIKLGAAQLLDIINEIFEFSSFQSGEFQLEVQPCSLQTLVKETCDSYLAETNLKNIGYSCDIDNDLPEIIYTDANRVEKTMRYLISNAIKFTEQGSVKVNVSTSNDNDTSQSIVITITDTGIGIAESEFEKIFSPFYQIDGSGTRAQGGTGIGLALARETVRQLGGEITLESQLEKGSCFTISLPLITQNKTDNC